MCVCKTATPSNCKRIGMSFCIFIIYIIHYTASVIPRLIRIRIKFCGPAYFAGFPKMLSGCRNSQIFRVLVVPTLAVFFYRKYLLLTVVVEVAHMHRVAMTEQCISEYGFSVIVQRCTAVNNLVLAVVINIADAQIMVTLTIHCRAFFIAYMLPLKRHFTAVPCVCADNCSVIIATAHYNTRMHSVNIRNSGKKSMRSLKFAVAPVTAVRSSEWNTCGRINRLACLAIKYRIEIRTNIMSLTKIRGVVFLVRIISYFLGVADLCDKFSVTVL